MAFDATIRIVAAGAAAAAADLDRVGKSVEAVGAGAGVASSGTERLALQLGRLVQFGLAGGAIAGLVGSFKAASAAIFEASVSAERLRTGLTFALGTGAAQEIAYLRGVTNQLGLQFESTASAYMKFAAAARGTALEGAGARQVFEAVAKASAVMGLSTEQSQGALLALQQMMSKGNVQAEELRGQLGERLPGAFQIAARAMGVTTAELGKMLEAGGLAANDFLPKFARQLEQELGGSADKAAQRLEAAINRMANAYERFKQSLGETGISQGKAAGASALANDLTAISEAMDRVRERGGGFMLQINEALAVAIGRALQLQRVFPLFMTSAGAAEHMQRKAAEAEAQLEVLNQRLVNNPQSYYLRNEIFQLEQFIARAREAQVLAKLPDQTSAEARRLGLDLNTGAEDARLARQAAAGQSRSEWFGKYQTDAQKLRTELEAARKAFDGVLPPDLEARIREKFVKPNDDAARAMERQMDLLTQLSGFQKDYRQSVLDIQALRARGLIDEEQYIALINELVAKQPIVAKALKEQADTQAAADKATRDAEQASVKHWEALQKEVATLQEQTATQLAANEALRSGKDSTIELAVARLRDAAAQAERLALIEQDKNLNFALADQYREQAKALRALADAKQNGIGAKAAKEAADAWQRTADELGRALTDSLFRAFESGKGFFDTLLSSIKSLLKTTVLKVLVQPVQYGMNQFLAGLMGQQQPGGATGVWGSLSQLGSLYGMGSRVGGQVGGLFGSSTGGGAVNSYLTTGGVEGSIVGGGTGGGAGAVGGGMGAMGWAALAAAAYMRGSSEYSKGWNNESARRGKDEMFGGDAIGRTFKDLSVDNILYSLGRKLGMSDKWASILSGSTAIAQLIGRQAPKVTDQGITGTLGGAAGADVQTFQDWLAKGGWFRRDKRGTNYGQLDGGMAGALVEQARGLQDAAAEYGKLLGLPTQALVGVTTQMRVSFTGKAEEDTKAVAEAFKKYQDDLFATFGDAVKPFRRLGEDVADTVKRLANLQSFSEGLNTLGGIFSRVALLGVDAREGLIALAGGMDQLKQQAASFVQQYYNRDEIAGIKAREVQQALAGVGITQDIGTKDQFRTLVESLDVSTELGRKQLATLLGVADSFANVADYLAEAGGTLSGAAALAPASGTLGALFQTASTDQVTAINQVENAVVEVRDAVISLRDTISNSGSIGAGGWRGWTEPQEVVSLP